MQKKREDRNDPRRWAKSQIFALEGAHIPECAEKLDGFSLGPIFPGICRIGSGQSQEGVNGKVALARLDTMIGERVRDVAHRERTLGRDRAVLERRQVMLQQERRVYLIGDEQVSRRTLNRDALLRAKSFGTDREILEHLTQTVEALRIQRSQTSSEIESASSEQVRLDGEVDSLSAQLENLKARQAVAQTREESKYVFDRSAFDQAREKVATIRATIAEQNKRLDFYGRRGHGAKGLIPADIEAEEENGLEAIAQVLGEVEDEEEPVPVAALTR